MESPPLGQTQELGAVDLHIDDANGVGDDGDGQVFSSQDNDNLQSPDRRKRLTARAEGLSMPQELHSPKIHAPPTVDSYRQQPIEENVGFIATQKLAAERSVQLPCPETAFEPKVMIPFVTKTGETPRKIEIERRKRLYSSQNIADLLVREGVDLDLIHPLPLDLFDDTEFDCRTPEEWISLGMDGSTMTFVPAKAFKNLGPSTDKSRNHSVWNPCKVLQYNPQKELFQIEWSSNLHDKNPKSQEWLSRIYILFDAEDPFRFAKRISSAYNSRSDFYSRLRYNLYIDSMPTDELPTLDKEQTQRITAYTFNTKKMKGKDTKVLFNEVKTDYGRSVNQVTFDLITSDPEKCETMGIQLPPRKPVQPTPERGTITIPEHNFSEQFTEFTFHSFLTRGEIINAIVKVRAECNRVITNQIYNTSINKSVRLDEFDQSQIQTFTATAAHLKDVWVSSLKNSIRASLKDVGKGWFNLQEKNKEVYEISKLKKFMTMIRFLMQDTLRFLAESSISKYEHFIEAAASATVSVSSFNDVKVSYLHPNQATATGKRIPLFLVDLLLAEGEITYSTPLKQFENIPVTIFDKGLQSLHDIPQMEPLLLEGLFWSHAATVPSVHRMEEPVNETRTKIASLLASAVTHLKDYLALYGEFSSLLAMDPNQYIQKLEQSEPTIDILRQEIIKHQETGKNISDRIPTSVNLGLFQVNCGQILSALTGKCQKLEKMVLELIARKTRQENDSIVAEFNLIIKRIQERPRTIEELTETKKYMNSIAESTADLVSRIQKLSINYETMEDFRFVLPNEDFNHQWAMLACPKRIEDQITDSEKILELDKSKFLKELMAEEEAFKEDLEEMMRVVMNFARLPETSKVEDTADQVKKVQKQLTVFEGKARLFNSRQALFGLEQKDYGDVYKVTRDFEPYYQLWTTVADWQKWHNEWMTCGFTSIDAEELEKNVNNAWKTMFKCVKLFKDKESTGSYNIAAKIKAEMDDFKPHVPLIVALRNPGMRARHWEKLSQDVGFELHPKETSNLKDILAMNLEGHTEAITKAAEYASKEYSIEFALDKMMKEWEPINFDVVDYRDSGTSILRGSDDINQMLDDHIAMTQSMSFSAFKKPFEERIAKWEEKLQLVAEILEEWTTCQRQWLYLEPIFHSEDINRQMPTEGKRFAQVDKTWRKIMGDVKKNPHVLTFSSTDKLLENLQESNRLLELVQKGLSDYLETKRLAFPRFYFLSNDEMLAILSQATDPKAVQPHLRKCFENIASLEFESDLKITAMYSAEGEKVPFNKPFYPKGNVENWLLEVENTMKSSIHHTLKQSLVAYPKTKRSQWVQDWPGQIVLAGSQIYWTAAVERAITQAATAGLRKLRDVLLRQLTDLTDLVRRNLKPLARLTLGSLIVIDVHARDVVSRMIEAGVSTIYDFDWIGQMRYYWYESDCVVRMVNSSFVYGHEYLGNTSRLVITPLTDRCYMTLTSALHMQLGGAPQGPAGTGKTESTKDLAKALAKQCVVFNCSDGLDYLAMGKFFKGLAASGAWACFDEFNRIDLEVLSVIAQQILTIQKAIQSKLKRFVFEGVELNLNPAFAVFITMNPGYAGRTELPDNLKALFRPVAMMVPDYSMIAEISLFSFGFRDAGPLAKKMTATFKLSSEQLSSQDHYDFGMRAVKTVISAAGNLKREFPKMAEELILLRALSDCNTPKFLAEDLPLFNGIISDLFPGVKQQQIDYGELMRAIQAVCNETNIQAVDSFTLKCIQLYETTVVRHGLMLVGPTGGGKTTCTRTLAKALSKLKDNPQFGAAKVRTWFLNPKSITMGQLYGEFDPTTHEWADGILAKLVRMGAEDSTTDKKWVILDGPVDALWIENMNTLLDDNKKLCLSSGEIIALKNTQTMMFEVEDLSEASPATVSRCGMVYMEPSALGILPLFTSWSKGLPAVFNGYHAKLIHLFEIYVPQMLVFLRKNVREIVPSIDGVLIHSMMQILDSFLIPVTKGEDGSPLPVAQVPDISDLIEPMFIFALIWSVGCSSDKEGRKLLDRHLRDEMSKHGSSCELPEANSIYDYKYDMKTKSWIGWMDTIPEFRLNSKLQFSQMIVPTIDSVRHTFLLDLLIVNQKNVLVVGPTGTGKSITVSEKLMKGLDERYLPVLVNFSAQTSANQTQDILDGKMDKRRKGVFGPPAGRYMIIFVDDVNMPAKEKYGAQPPLELIRQYLDHKGWYDRKGLVFRELIDVQLVCAMGPPGGGRNPISNRFLRHFNLLAFNELGDDSYRRIYTTILGCYMDNFGAAVRAFNQPMVDATIEVYNTITRELLPTPSKSHYTFNMRDLSKVFQGILSADPGKLSDIRDVVRLWVHECERVFQDRLVDGTDRAWFTDLLKQNMNKYFNLSWGEVVKVDRLIYGDFLVPNANPRIYQEITDTSRLHRVIEEYLDEYNATTTNRMNLVMFMDAIHHLSRISRVIRQPYGNALLLGMEGSGRQSLSRLAAHMAEYEIVELLVNKGYGIPEWHEDVKKVLFVAGLEGKSIMFLCSDTQLVNERFLEDINGILNSGEVPNIFTPDEIDKINTTIRPIAQSLNLPLTKEAIYSHFVQRVRNNIHVVLCMSPIGEAFRSRLRMFPSLVNCCTIDWFSEWPNEALRSVASNYLQDISLGSEELLENVISACVYVHETVSDSSKKYLAQLGRYNYVTPTSYLELLGTFKILLADKRTELGNMRRRLEIGLEKLQGTQREVAVMQEELKALQPVLVQTSKDTDEMMAQIARDKVKADETRVYVMKEEAETSKKAEETKEIANDAKRDLDEALPALEAAQAALRQINKNDIVEVKSMQRPPPGVKIVLEAVCIIRSIKPKKVDGAKGKQDDYWEPAKLMLGDPKFLDQLLKFDKDNVSPATIEKLQPYLQMDEFQPAAVAKVSKACTSLCLWVRAIEKYYHVNKSVEPKRERLRIAEDSLEQTRKALEASKGKLREVEDNIDELERKYSDSVAKKEELARKVEECTLKLERAHKLINGLGGEGDRWKETVRQLDESIYNLPGDIVISAGTIAYLGVFTAAYRTDMVGQWHQKLAQLSIPYTPHCNLRSTAADQIKLRQWSIFGLPRDQLSIENGIIISKSRRWPLLIDPQGQANKWIKNMEKENGLDVIKLSDKDFVRTLENGIRFGKAVLLENVYEELDPILDSVLKKQTFKQTGNTVIKLGDAIVPYHPDFKFYITTRLRNPHYRPEVCTKVVLLNFTLSQEGLADQLLGIVVAKERPDLEEAKAQLVISNAAMRRELKELEDKILFLLSNSQGYILDDEVLIETLAASKTTSQEINQKVVEAESTEREIDQTRSQYEPVAVRGAILFFCVADLASIDPMYQNSLGWFIQLFTAGLTNAPASTVLEERMTNIMEFFTYSLYLNVCRSLFEKHKLLFSFMLCIKIMEGRNEIDPVEWRFLLTGGSALDSGDMIPNPASEWLVNKNWTQILELSKLPAFIGFEKFFASNTKEFKRIFDSSEAHQESLPDPWGSKLTPLQKMLILRCLRSDSVIASIQNFVTINLGQQFIEPPTFNLASSYKDATPATPLIFILSAGADPAAELFKFAEEMRFGKKLNSISLGQGQGPKAKQMIQEAMERGTWVMLQNCHLAASWMSVLEQIVDSVSLEKVHRDYRLWLTSMPSDKFPAAVLQNGVKMTNEPPKGLRANLLRTYSSFDDTYLNQTTKPFVWRKLLFSLSFFHAVILERRKFGALGWNIPYEYTTGDLDICIRQLQMFLDEYEQIPYKVLKQLTGHINYGGRVTDDLDRRTLMNLLESHYSPEVLKDEFKFSPSGTYTSINAETRKAYMDYIRSLPINDSPEVFGLHENANITFAQNETSMIFDDLLALQPKTSSGSGRSRDTVIKETATDILQRLPKVISEEESYKRYPISYKESMNTVLNQEIIRYNKLLRVVQRSLNDILKALRGLVVMSQALEQMSNSLYDNQVPKMWADKAYPSLKPLSAWVADLRERCGFIENWFNKGIPVVFWISGFFFPQAFLTGTLQNYARKHVISIDSIVFSFRIMQSADPIFFTEKPEEGCYINGLYLEGSRWDYENKCLTESKPKELYSLMPVIHLQPSQQADSNADKYICPVYKTLTRAGTLSTTGHSTNYVMSISVPSKQPAEHWIKRGVALLCGLNY
eukprot:TRINITY_DN1638_c0_g1_i1.p1 TRINITY_DN1638_c0_g1~~TRINITY_DN1638_c0_g1_i1.p1  ORF type:complete len:4126 (-),score=976.49 TRINITY_DN1638_c0_g1_i1:597-12974(-)